MFLPLYNLIWLKKNKLESELKKNKLVCRTKKERKIRRTFLSTIFMTTKSSYSPIKWFYSKNTWVQIILMSLWNNAQSHEHRGITKWRQEKWKLRGFLSFIGCVLYWVWKIKRTRFYKIMLQIITVPWPKRTKPVIIRITIASSFAAVKMTCMEVAHLTLAQLTKTIIPE